MHAGTDLVSVPANVSRGYLSEGVSYFDAFGRRDLPVSIFPPGLDVVTIGTRMSLLPEGIGHTSVVRELFSVDVTLQILIQASGPPL